MRVGNMIKIDNLKLSKENKDILNEYKIELTAIKLKKIDTTVESYIEDIYKYLEYIEEKKHINSALNINEEDIIDYLTYLDKNNYEKTSIVRKIVSIKLFHKYLSEKYHIEDISIKIDKPRVRRKLPNILSIEEVDNLLDIELNNVKGYISFYVDFFEDKHFKNIKNRKYIELPTELNSKITMIEIFDTANFIDFIDSEVNLEFGNIYNNQIEMKLNINDKLIKLEYKGLLNIK